MHSGLFYPITACLLFHNIIIMFYFYFISHTHLRARAREHARMLTHTRKQKTRNSRILLQMGQMMHSIFIVSCQRLRRHAREHVYTRTNACARVCACVPEKVFYFCFKDMVAAWVRLSRVHAHARACTRGHAHANTRARTCALSVR